VIVAFGGVVAAARLLRLSDEQMAHAIGLTATTMGGLAIGTNSWARDTRRGTRLCAQSTPPWLPVAVIRSTKTCWRRRGAFSRSSAAERSDTERLTREFGKRWDIVTYSPSNLRPAPTLLILFAGTPD